MELLGNEYHLLGPVPSPTKRSGCSSDCKYRTVSDVSRRRKSDQRKRVCDCTLRIDHVEDSEPIFHSTGISADERDDADRRDGDFNADGYRDDAEPIPEPSRKFPATPSLAGNAKKARVDDRGVRRADETDDETTTEEDMDCTCDAEVVTREEHRRIRPSDRSRVRNQRNGRRNDVEEDEEDEGERVRGENEEDEGEGVDEEDEDMEDSAYEELRARGPRRRTAARERELRRWIRRCRQECERRRGR